nr:YadA-like family protein [Bartonella bovis]
MDTGITTGREDTDAVNIAQLKALRKWVEEEGGTWQLSVNGKDPTRVNSKNRLDLVGGKNIKIAKNKKNNKVKFDLNQDLRLRSIVTGASFLGESGLLIENGPAVTTAGIDAGNKNIKNVANGTLSRGSKDAVNAGQLYSISNDIATHLGGGAIVRDDVLLGPRYTLSHVSTDGTVKRAVFNDVGGAFGGLDANVRNVNKRLTYVYNNFSKGIDKISKNVKNNTLMWDKSEQAFVALHTEGQKRENSKITFLADGDIAPNSTDAITGSQLYETNTTIAKYFGGSAEYNGQWKEPTFTITNFGAQGKSGEQQYHNVTDAFNAVNTSISGVNDRVQQVEVQVKYNSLNWDDSQRAYDARHNSQPGRITNVANGAIKKDSTDVVTGKQLWKTNRKVNELENRVDNVVSRVDILNDRAVTYDIDERSKKTNTITLAGGNESDPVLIDNVADGKIEKGSKQAVNGGQLHDYTEEQMKLVLADANKYTDKKIEDVFSSAVARANTYTDMKFNALNYRVESVQKEARQAAAIGLAVTNLNYINTPGMLSVAFGSSIWRGQSAIAFGAGYMSENGRMRSSLSVTTSGGHWGVGTGLSIALK